MIHSPSQKSVNLATRLGFSTGQVNSQWIFSHKIGLLNRPTPLSCSSKVQEWVWKVYFN